MNVDSLLILNVHTKLSQHCCYLETHRAEHSKVYGSDRQGRHIIRQLQVTPCQFITPPHIFRLHLISKYSHTHIMVTFFPRECEVYFLTLNAYQLIILFDNLQLKFLDGKNIYYIYVYIRW